MKNILPSALDTRVKVGRRTYRLRPTAANVLQAMDAIKAEDMTEPDRVRLAVWFLYRWPRPRDAAEALKAAFDLLNEESPYRPDKGAKQNLDLEQDAAMIYAAFRQQYGIDLRREVLRLDWRVFLALLGGITDATRLGEIEGIRQRDLPKWTPYNGEQRRELMRLKSIYAIRNPAKRGQTMQEGLRGMVEALIAMAGGDPDGEVNPKTDTEKAGGENG